MIAAPITPEMPAAWLKAAGRPRRRLAMTAAMLTIADVVPAIGFAAGLAMAISSFEHAPGTALPWLALSAASLIVRGLISHGGVLIGARTARAVKADVRAPVLTDLLGRGRRSDRGLTAAVEGVTALDGYFSRFMPLRLAAGASPLLIIAAAAMASPFAAGILLFTLLPFILGMALAGTAAAGESRKHFEALERLSGLFIDRIRALPALLAFGAEARTTAEIARASDELETRTARVMRTAFLSSAVLEFFAALAVALIAIYCGFNLLRLLPFPVPETLDLPRAFFVLALAPEVYVPLRRLAAAYHDKQAAEAAAPSLAVSPPAPTVRVRLADGPPAIRFRDVAIAYDGRPPVLQGFNLDVRPGQIVALVGASGAGKSSLLHLLLGLAPLSAGEIEVGGLRLGPGDNIAADIAWTSQSPVVLPGTLAQNIGLADPTACARRLRMAADQAGLTSALDRPIDERGGGLSGGERRRLGLARAMLKRAPILLLDEPTAHLDADSEHAILEVIREAARGRTTLIATHSATVAALADRVVRL
jgi:ATP-binding cassette subfamily C protein CydD